MRCTPILLIVAVAAGAGCSGGDVDPSPTPALTALTEVAPWDNATVYFVMTDRFLDGDPSNNHSYGRESDGGDEVGTFHGGDLAGLTQALEDGYFSRLGVSALWITAPYEQVHGWVPGGSAGDFKHYAYHGYYALDFTRLDANMGTEDQLKTFVDTAHRLGIRVIFDVVMNHPGYSTIQDLDELGVDVLLDGYEDATLGDYYGYINFSSTSFADWWGVDWIRAGLGGGYDPGGTTDQTMSLSYLPDFKTEATTRVGLPPMFANKPDTHAIADDDSTVRDYLVRWLSAWVRTYGIDGFRCDTAKHVELASWQALKDASDAGLAAWRAEHPDLALPDSAYADPSAPFWMTGEVYPHGVEKDAYFDNGFDSLINFTYVPVVGDGLTRYSDVDETWASYAAAINSDPTFNVLSYISSHDTYLFFDKYAEGDLDKQKRAGTLLLLAPGAVQIFYGDENARPLGPAASDANQGTRSDYQWGANPDVLAHWRRIGQFRKRHPAVGAGSHQKISDAPYAFTRVKGDDVIYAVLGAQEELELDVSAGFEDGAVLVDAMTSAIYEVKKGAVDLTPGESGIILLERSE